MTSKVKVARSRDASDRRWSRTKPPRNTKIGRNVVHPTDNNAHQFQGQRSRSPGLLMLRCWDRKYVTSSCFPNGKAYKFQNCYADGACYSELPRPAIKAYKVGYCTQAGHTVSAETDSHTTCCNFTPYFNFCTEHCICYVDTEMLVSWVCGKHMNPFVTLLFQPIYHFAIFAAVLVTSLAE